jgi:hypothetical protein
MNELIIDGQCGGCHKKVRLCVPNPQPGQEVNVRCRECGSPIRYTLSQSDLLKHYVRQHAIAEVRREHFASR